MLPIFLHLPYKISFHLSLLGAIGGALCGGEPVSFSPPHPSSPPFCLYSTPTSTSSQNSTSSFSLHPTLYSSHSPTSSFIPYSSNTWHQQSKNFPFKRWTFTIPLRRMKIQLPCPEKNSCSSILATIWGNQGRRGECVFENSDYILPNSVYFNAFLLNT